MQRTRQIAILVSVWNRGEIGAKRGKWFSLVPKRGWVGWWVLACKTGTWQWLKWALRSLSRMFLEQHPCCNLTSPRHECFVWGGFPKTPYFTNIIPPLENKSGTPSIIYMAGGKFPKFMNKSATMFSACVSFLSVWIFLSSEKLSHMSQKPSLIRCWNHKTHDMTRAASCNNCNMPPFWQIPH